MPYPPRFFEINLRFAQKVADISEQSLDSALLQYTNLYVRFGLSWDLCATNPVWREYLDGVHQADDRTEWTYHFYSQRQQLAASAALQPSFGCFSYTALETRRIRLHFHNNEPAEYSPLSRERMSHRLVDLTGMFAHLKQTVSAPATVIGASWLYNLEAYRRLFPPAYLATAQACGHDFPYLPLWGQFVDHRGHVKDDLVEHFLERLDRQHSLTGIEQCFPFQVLHLESSLQDFYPFYGV